MSYIVGPAGIEPTVSAFTAQSVCLDFSAPRIHIMEKWMQPAAVLSIPPSCEVPSTAFLTCARSVNSGVQRVLLEVVTHSGVEPETVD
jgi:hypothetical protein